MSAVEKPILVDKSVYEELDNVAKMLGKSKKEIVESALELYMDGIIADSITQQIIDGKMRVFDSEYVYDQLGINVKS